MTQYLALKASNQFTFTARNKPLRCFDTSTLYQKTTRFYLPMLLIMWWIPKKSSSPRHLCARIVAKYHLSPLNYSASQKMHTFAWNASKITTQASSPLSIREYRSLKNLKSLDIVTSTITFSWNYIAVCAVKLCAWTVRYLEIIWVERWANTL